MDAVAIDALWQQLCGYLGQHHLLPPGNPTPAEIARHADRVRGDTAFGRFVREFYYPRLYGGGTSGLSEAGAQSLADTILGTASPRREPSPAAAGAAASIAGRPYPTLLAAVAAADSGQEILVEPGLHRDPLVIERPLILIGRDGPERVVLATDGATPLALAGSGILVRNLVIRVDRGATPEPLAAIDIRRGEPVLEHCEISNAAEGGDGVWSRPAAGPTLRDCVIADCRRHALWIGRDGAATLDTCRLLRSGAAGVMALGHARLSGCRIADGAGDGLDLREGAAQIETCQIERNGRCGINVQGAARPVFRQSRCQANRSAGGMIADGAAVTLEDCRFEDNAASGLQVSQAILTARGCHFSNNGHYGLLVDGDSRIDLEDCRALDNASTGVGLRDDTEATLKRTEMSGNADHGLWIGGRSRCDADQITARNNRQQNLRAPGPPDS